MEQRPLALEDFLYLRGSAVDLHLPKVKGIIDFLPVGILQLDSRCRPIIMEYELSSSSQSGDFTLGYGFHHSDVVLGSGRYPKEGLIFRLNPPTSPDVRDVEMYTGRTLASPSFKVKDMRFLLTKNVFDLDTEVCIELATNEKYEKPTAAQSSSDIPF